MPNLVNSQTQLKRWFTTEIIFQMCHSHMGDYAECYGNTMLDVNWTALLLLW